VSLPATIAMPQEEIRQFCQRWSIVELALFGSVLSDQFRDDSDIDVLVTFSQDARWTLFDLVHMQAELERLFERPVDLLTRRGVEASKNPIRREAILASAEVIYAV
jgi:uncharacterized protein